MSPELLLLLLLLAAESTAPLPDVNTGLEFVVAFPENIAYYYPDRPKMVIQITALYDETKITIKQHSFGTICKTQDKGASQDYILHAKMEIYKEETSDITLQIHSDKSITVHAINQKSSSLQTALVLPTDKLSLAYFIPPVPEIQRTTRPAEIVTTDVTERSPFKLVIVNGNKPNEVKVEGSGNETFSLQPFQIQQIWVKAEMELRKVTANHPVAVLFGHTCAIYHSCTCGQLFTSLPPAQSEVQKYYIPEFLAKYAENKSVVLLSKENSTKVQAFDMNSPLVEFDGSAIFYRPGLLISLIPETDFASCYVVSTINDTMSYAVIVVRKNLTDGVRVRDLPVQKTLWQELNGTDFRSASVTLLPGKSAIWHTSSKMAVYFVGNKENAWFGNPAPILSHIPDFRGCVLSPEIVKIGPNAGGWRESLQNCSEDQLDLVSFPDAQLQTQIYEQLRQANKNNLQEVWIGMRRSSMSGEWYWLSDAKVNHSNWEEGEPGTMNDGQCAIMSLAKGFGWRDEDCCKAAHPVCYKEPVFFPVE
ncbi:hypothetical protein PBY51_017095 [Eleginops maclovinus]|uniref:C-type lectin domain-containing protein n=1 Tax=Eleginops maclovinus TaxID=56733 RepID=A0AAN7XJ10_ELEMC|nr:hypothetical protein PBY51_017095 [Eleginops maclovinus]